MEHECRAQGYDQCRFEVGFRSEMERRYPGCSEDYRSVDLFGMFQSLKTSLRASRNKIKMLESRLTKTTDEAFEPVIGSSPQMLRVLEQVKTVASYDSSILITGESGTGKEVIAKALHKASLRAEKPFVAINCATLSESLQNSELFGHVRGAFTGAVKDRAGLFEQAHEGTLFLDEIGELAAPIQASFLRVLQEGIVIRVGDHRERQVNVRIIAATHQDLGTLVKEKRFRQDLYYRLNVIPLHLPPLRERGNDILLLAQHFCERFANRFKKQVEGIDCDVARLFMRHHWPGNIRELYNTMERAVLFARASLIKLDDLPDCLIHAEIEHSRISHETAILGPLPAQQAIQEEVPQTLEDQERQRILRALERANGNRGLAADALGISRSTLWRKIKKWRL
jgi:two-component system response regulator HydG